METKTPVQPIAYSILEAARVSALSKSWLYVEMATGRLPFRKAGARRLILAADLESYLRSLPAEVS